jgi:hypothetical protein
MIHGGNMKLGNHVDMKCRVSYADLLIQTLLLEV